MGTRLELHQILVSILGSNNVYYQPPASVKMKYPCIVYEKQSIRSDFGDDIRYNYKWQYVVTYISKNPDDIIPEKLLLMPYTAFSRQYISDNLYHNSFYVYF